MIGGADLSEGIGKGEYEAYRTSRTSTHYTEDVTIGKVGTAEQGRMKKDDRKMA